MNYFLVLQVLAAVDHGLVPFFIVVIHSVGFALWMRSLVVPQGDPHVTLADIEPLELSLLATPSDRLRFALTGMASLIGRGDGANKTDKLDPEGPFNLPPPPPAGVTIAFVLLRSYRGGWGGAAGGRTGGRDEHGG